MSWPGMRPTKFLDLPCRKSEKVLMVNSPRLREEELPMMSNFSALAPSFIECAPRTTERSSENWWRFWKKLRGVLRSEPKRLVKPPMLRSPTIWPGMKARLSKVLIGAGASLGVVRLKA